MGGSVVNSTDANTQVFVNRSAEGDVVVANSTITFANGLYDGASQKTLKDASGDTAGVMGVLKSGTNIRYLNFTKGTRGTITVTDSSPTGVSIAELIAGMSTDDFANGDHVRFFWEEVRSGSTTGAPQATQITINASTFPGTFKIVGDTFIRSQKTGEDSAFQFVIPKAE